MSEILEEAVERISSESEASDNWQKAWSQGGNWELEWSQNG